MTRRLPTSLKDAITYFADVDVATEFFRDIRWPDGVECPTCGSRQVSYFSTCRVWKCKNDHPKRQFTVKFGTIFEDSAHWLGQVASRDLAVGQRQERNQQLRTAPALGVTQKTAWFMLHRIRLAMQASGEKLNGEVEADETFIGGKCPHHAQGPRRRAQAIKGRVPVGKVAVWAAAAAQRRVTHRRAVAIPGQRKRSIKNDLPNVTRPQAAASYTDDAPRAITRERQRIAVTRSSTTLSRATRRRVHTNGLENFWSLLKRI